MDRELQAMERISTALSELESPEVRRVLQWALDRFDVTNIPAPILEQVPESESEGMSTPDVSSPDRFEHLADLMDATQARTGVEKALVAGYWYQVILGQPDFTGYQINSQLKNLGHGLTNVTAALDKHIRRKPALVLQLAKGKAKMSHKKYKLTHAGVRRVEEMMGANE